MRLETARLLLRFPTQADATAVQRLAGDERIAATTLNMPHPYPLDAAQQWIIQLARHNTDTHYTFVLCQKADEALIGAMGLRLDDSHDRAEVGYWVGVPHWRQGYATEALREIMRFGFAELGLHRMYGRYFSDNVASRRVMEKAGMTYEGTLRGHILKWGAYKDMGVCGMLRAEWKAHDDG